MKEILISLIVPTIDIKILIENLLPSLGSLNAQLDKFELVVINQTTENLLDYFDLLKFRVIIIDSKKIPAALARNLGAKHSSGSHLFFLDDDAKLCATDVQIEKMLSLISANHYNSFICERGELEDGVFRSHWTKGVSKVDFTNFPTIAIEWNIIIERSAFLNAGGFIGIGPGSSTSAQCGEGFCLIACLLKNQQNFMLIDIVQVIHPSLTSKRFTPVNFYGYQYGSAFAVGYSIKFFPSIFKIYWILRFAISLILSQTVRYANLIKSIDGELESKRKLLLMARAYGFFDGAFLSSARNKSWLSKITN